MAVTTTRLSSSPYSWSSASVSWGGAGVGTKQIGDFGIDAFDVDAQESCAFAGRPLRLQVKAVTESIQVVSSSNRFAGKAIKRTLLVAENFDRHFTAVRTFVEQFSVSDKIGFNYFRSFFESFSVNERMGRLFAREIREAFGLSDAPRFSVYARIRDSFNFSVVDGRQITRVGHEYFGVRHSKDRRNIISHQKYALGFNDETKTKTVFNLAISEALTLTETQTKSLGVAIKETLTIYDGINRPPDVAISDMLTASGDMTAEQFTQAMDAAKIPGFGVWREFIAGDYDYRLAVFRAIVTSKNSDRGMFSNVQAIVDVPDIIDRGSATIELATMGVTVRFNRQYHIIPEIVLTTKGGTGSPATPEVTDVNTTEFHVIMKDASGNLVEGSFAWAAHGY